MDMNNDFDIHHSTPDNYDAIPRYDKRGRLLSQDERQQLAFRRGQCVRCGIKTHSGSRLLRKPVTNNDVFQGRCIRCSPESVPPAVLQDWETRNNITRKPSSTSSHRKSTAASGATSRNRISRMSASSDSSVNNDRTRTSLRGATSAVTAATSRMALSPRNNDDMSTSSSTAASYQSGSRGAPLVPNPLLLDQSKAVGSTTPTGGSRPISGSSLETKTALKPLSSPGTGRNVAKVSVNLSSVNRGDRTSLVLPSGATIQTVNNGNQMNAMRSEPALPRYMPESERHESAGIPSSSHPSRLDFSQRHGSNNNNSSSLSLQRESAESANSELPRYRDTMASIGQFSSQDSINGSSWNKMNNSSAMASTYLDGSLMTTHMEENKQDLSKLCYALHTSSSKDDQRAALDALRHCNDPKLSNQLEPFLLSMINTSWISAPRMMDMTCGLLTRLMLVDPATWVSEEVIQTLLQAIVKLGYDADFLEWALCCLACAIRQAILLESVEQFESSPRNSITSDSSAKNFSNIIDHAEVIRVLQKTLHNQPKEAVALEWTADCLCLLVEECMMDEDDNLREAKSNVILEAMLRVDSINTLLTAMRVNQSEARPTLWSLRVLALSLSLCENVTDKSLACQFINSILEADFCTLASKILRIPNIDTLVFSSVVDILAALVVAAATSDQDRVEDVSNKVCNCLPSLYRTLNNASTDDFCRQTAISFMNTLLSFCTTSDSLSLLINKKLIETLLPLLDEYIDSNDSIRYESVWALWKCSYLSFDASAFESDVARSVLDTLRKCKAVNPHDDHIVSMYFDVLGNFAKVEGVGKDVLSIGEVVSAVLSENNLSLVVQNSACFAIARYIGEFSGKLASTESIIPVTSITSIVQRAKYSVSACNLLASLTESQRGHLLSSGFLLSMAADIKTKIESNYGGDELPNMLLSISALLVSDKYRATSLPIDLVVTLCSVVEKQSADTNLVCCCLKTMTNTLLASALPIRLGNSIDIVLKLLENQVSDDKNMDAETVANACAFLAAAHSPPYSQNDNRLQKSLHLYVKVLDKFSMDSGNVSRMNVIVAVTDCLVRATHAMREIPVDVSADDISILIACSYRTTGHGAVSVNISSNILSTIYNLLHVCEDVLIEGGAITATIDTMVTHEMSEAIYERGCTILAYLSSRDNLQVSLSIAQTDGIELLCQCLTVFSTKEWIVLQSCKALSHLSIDADIRSMIKAVGGLSLMITASKNYPENSDLLERVCTILLNLTIDISAKELHGSGVVGAVILVMKSNLEIPKLQESCMGILQNVSMKGSACKEAIVNGTGVERILAAMKEYMMLPSLIERSFSALWSLAVLTNSHPHMAKLNVIKLVLINMMNLLEYERVQKQGCGCLTTLAASSANKEIMRNEGGVDAILLAMWSHHSSQDVQTEACRALMTLSYDQERNEVMLATESEVGAVISAMRRFPTAEKIQIYGCASIRNLLLSVDNVHALQVCAQQIRNVVSTTKAHYPQSCAEMANQIMNSLT